VQSVEDGLDEVLVGSITRDDGTTQGTYNGWPLYYFSGDSAAGDVNGQGVNEVWWVLDATGTPIGA
jgi:predicted lipoprotein with Yx(FWY)xxD motif